MAVPCSLDQKRLAIHAKKLADMDAGMATILKNHGVPPLWSRPPVFDTLLRIILEQQVSLTSAEAMYRRLQQHVQPLTPETILNKGEDFLRSFGVTRQKAAYFVNVSRAISEGELDLLQLTSFDDDNVIRQLTSIKGIGPWTAKIYLLMALGRPDVWPVGDIALAAAAGHLKGLAKRPSQTELADMARAWAPYRATAARMLWNYYLNEM